jgi:hypothetical protein
MLNVLKSWVNVTASAGFGSSESAILRMISQRRRYDEQSFPKIASRAKIPLLFQKFGFGQAQSNVPIGAGTVHCCKKKHLCTKRLK